MPGQTTHEVTALLSRWSGGDKAALDLLIPLVQDELRRIAHRRMSRERPGHTLQTTALVNEAYVRLVERRDVRWQDRAHFFALSAQIMRNILVDRARAKNYQKRGGGARQARASELLALDEALTRLASRDELKARIVELRHFGGLTVEEVAKVLEIPPIKVKRQWKAAVAWLQHALKQGGSDGD